MLFINSKQFMTKMINDVNLKDYWFILPSNDIKSKGKYKNATSVMSLIPSPDDVALFIETKDSKSYEKRYRKYLSKPENMATLAVLVKAQLDGKNMVFMCSQIEEKEFKYIKFLRKFIEDTFKIKTYSYKDFKEDGDKVFKVKNKPEVKKIITKVLEKTQGSNSEIEIRIDDSKLKKKLETLGKKDLKIICKKQNIKIKDDMSKNDIIKKLMKKIK